MVSSLIRQQRSIVSSIVQMLQVGLSLFINLRLRFLGARSLLKGSRLCRNVRNILHFIACSCNLGPLTLCYIVAAGSELADFKGNCKLSGGVPVFGSEYIF